MTTAPNKAVENPLVPDRAPDDNPDIGPQPVPGEGGETELAEVQPSSGDESLTADPSLADQPETGS